MANKFHDLDEPINRIGTDSFKWDYEGENGKHNSVYATNLASLREKEKKINKDMDDLLIADASVKKLTVNTLFERYMATKNIKERTKKNYIRMHGS